MKKLTLAAFALSCWSFGWCAGISFVQDEPLLFLVGIANVPFIVINWERLLSCLD